MPAAEGAPHKLTMECPAVPRRKMFLDVTERAVKLEAEEGFMGAAEAIGLCIITQGIAATCIRETRVKAEGAILCR